MRNQFTFYKSFDDVAEDLSDNQLALYIRTLLDVQFLRVKLDYVSFEDKMLNLVWKSQKYSIQTSITGYLDSQKNPKVKKPYLGVYDTNFNPLVIPSEGIAQQVKGKGKGKGQVKGKEEEQVKEQKSTVFKKPSISEIQNYINSKSYSVDAENFYHFYESKNWMIGKNKMQYWRSALVNWNKKNTTKQFSEQKSLHQKNTEFMNSYFGNEDNSDAITVEVG